MAPAGAESRRPPAGAESRRPPAGAEEFTLTTSRRLLSPTYPPHLSRPSRSRCVEQRGVSANPFSPRWSLHGLAVLRLNLGGTACPAKMGNMGGRTGHAGGTYPGVCGVRTTAGSNRTTRRVRLGKTCPVGPDRTPEPTELCQSGCTWPAARRTGNRFSARPCWTGHAHPKWSTGTHQFVDYSLFSGSRRMQRKPTSGWRLVPFIPARNQASQPGPFPFTTCEFSGWAVRGPFQFRN